MHPYTLNVAHGGRTTTISLPIREVDAPVAIRVPTDDGTAQIRSWDGALYVPMNLDEAREWPTCPALTPDSRHFKALMLAAWANTDIFASLDERIARLAKRCEDFLVIHGHVWVKTLEPVYALEVLGMGDNHSFTLVSIRRGTLHQGDVYRADAYDQVVADATRVAIERGDTDSLERIAATPRIDVLAPDVLTTPAREAALAL